MNKLFSVQRLTETTNDKAIQIATLYSDFLDSLEGIVIGKSPGERPMDTEHREWSYVRTKLQEASFYSQRVLSQRNS